MLIFERQYQRDRSSCQYKKLTHPNLSMENHSWRDTTMSKNGIKAAAAAANPVVWLTAEKQRSSNQSAKGTESYSQYCTLPICKTLRCLVDVLPICIFLDFNLSDLQVRAIEYSVKMLIRYMMQMRRSAKRQQIYKHVFMLSVLSQILICKLKFVDFFQNKRCLAVLISGTKLGGLQGYISFNQMYKTKQQGLCECVHPTACYNLMAPQRAH